MNKELNSIISNKAFILLSDSIKIFNEDPLTSLQYCMLAIDIMIKSHDTYLTFLTILELTENIEIIKKGEKPVINLNDIKDELANLKHFINQQTMLKSHTNKYKGEINNDRTSEIW